MFVGRWFPHPEDERPVLTLVLAPSILGGKGLPKHLSAFVGLLNEDSLVRAEDLTGNTFVDDMNLSLVSYTSHDSDCLTHLHNIPISHDNKTHAAINASFTSISPNLNSKFRSDMRDSGAEDSNCCSSIENATNSGVSTYIFPAFPSVPRESVVSLCQRSKHKNQNRDLPRNIASYRPLENNQ